MHPTSLAFCILATRNYMARARTLLDSLRPFHPEASYYLLVADAVGPSDRPHVEGVQVLRPDEVLDGGLFWHRVARYGAAGLAVSLKPVLMRHVLARGHQTVIYLDADMLVLHGLDSAVAALARAEILLSPHAIAPYPMDRHYPNDRSLLSTGIYNGGLLGVRQGAEARRFLDWWDERVHLQHLVDVPDGLLFGDQIWLTLAPSLFEGVATQRDPGYNVATWNLSERHLTWRDGVYYANEAPLVVFHFSRFDPHAPMRSIIREARPMAQPSPALERLAATYTELLLANGHDGEQGVPNGLQQFSDSTPFDARAHALLLEALEGGQAFPYPLDVGSEPSFLAWLEGPAPEADGPGLPISRYLWHWLRAHPDLCETFPDMLGEHRSDLMLWLAAHRQACGIPERFLPPALRSQPVPPPDLARLIKRVARLSPGVLAKGAWMGETRGAVGLSKRLITRLARLRCRLRP